MTYPTPEVLPLSQLPLTDVCLSPLLFSSLLFSPPSPINLSPTRKSSSNPVIPPHNQPPPYKSATTIPCRHIARLGQTHPPPGHSNMAQSDVSLSYPTASLVQVSSRASPPDRLRCLRCGVSLHASVQAASAGDARTRGLDSETEGECAAVWVLR
ncbi:hypothetical protein BGZ61DRAFT_137634 [Ilyonectria robusta]|uniref:uncharacterized protein n=1 Tax=Ilyonectria robusta TaxID=1079257 RepID=UPI001E8DC9CB|nr:uncharacterized protein BGZ61DRAFT_137634 [Ilyonectria robusta]KAH8735269.1 hypothetical protein BGZ61DRAFT_137634 [Ilyonectria robusta]